MQEPLTGLGGRLLQQVPEPLDFLAVARPVAVALRLERATIVLGRAPPAQVAGLGGIGVGLEGGSRDGGWRPASSLGRKEPIESLAEGVLLGVRHAIDSMLFQDGALIRAIDSFGADGVVYHPVKSCRTVSTGLADSRRVVMQERDVACLYLESDMMDRRVVSEAQLKNRIDAFFEGLESRRIRTAGAPASAATAPVGA